MSYILEIITINRKEKSFFLSNLANEGKEDILEGYMNWWRNEFVQSYIDNGYFVDDKFDHTQDFVQNEHGHWLAIKRIGLFKEPPMASDFFREYNEHTGPYRKMAMDWARENFISGEVNILNTNEDIAVKAASCQTGVCDRKSGAKECPTSGPLACVVTVGRDLQASKVKEYHIPLQSFVKFKTKVE